nr:hypothetical protein Iba_chr04eCG18530 [Ipomoea batatas]
MSSAMCSPTWSVARERMWSRSGTIVRIFSSRVEVYSPPSRSASRIGVEPGGLGRLGLLAGATISTSEFATFSFPLRLRGRDIWRSGSKPPTVAAVGGTTVEAVAPVASGGSAVNLRLPRATFFRVFLGPAGATAKLLSKTIPANTKRGQSGPRRGNSRLLGYILLLLSIVGSLKIGGGVGLRAPKDRIFIRLGGDLDHGLSKGFGLCQGSPSVVLDPPLQKRRDLLELGMRGSETEGRGEEVSTGRSGAEELGSTGQWGWGGGSVSSLGSDARCMAREAGDNDWYWVESTSTTLLGDFPRP